MGEFKPAIVVVGYNRPRCIARLLNSIEQAYYPIEDVTLVVSIDQSDLSDEVEMSAQSIPWTHGKKIYKRYKKRQGLKKHILKCGDLTETFGSVIILEDDLVVSPVFYSYALQALNRYADNDKIVGVGLYSHGWNGYSNVSFLPQNNGYDTYFGQFSITWGQCWEKTQWQKFRKWYFDNQVLNINKSLPANIECWGEKSWGKFFAYYIVENDLYYVIPYVSLSTNYSEIGEHNSIINNAHQVMILDATNHLYQFPTFENGIKYDIFFERILDSSKKICGILCSDICFNLNGQHRDSGGKQYLLSSNNNLKYEKVFSFGLMLRPIEENVLQEVPGEGISLYRLNKTYIELTPEKEFEYSRMNFELYDYTWKNLGKYTGKKVINKVFNKIGRVILNYVWRKK